jgi:HPt (histidine-containing phosphotransfer) domain-containing protein
VFLADMLKQIAAIKAYLAQGEVKKVGAIAHKIKGAAGNVFGMALQEIAHTMENAAKAGPLAPLNSLMPELEQRFELLQAAMTSRKEPRASNSSFNGGEIEKQNI